MTKPKPQFMSSGRANAKNIHLERQTQRATPMSGFFFCKRPRCFNNVLFSKPSPEFRLQKGSRTGRWHMFEWKNCLQAASLSHNSRKRTARGDIAMSSKGRTAHTVTSPRFLEGTCAMKGKLFELQTFGTTTATAYVNPDALLTTAQNIDASYETTAAQAMRTSLSWRIIVSSVDEFQFGGVVPKYLSSSLQGVS